MKVDKNLFFRQATMSICSSLSLETAMQRCMALLKTYMPADEMYLHLYDPGLRAFRTVAGATAGHGHKLDSITPLPKGIGQALEKETRRLFVLNQPEAEPGLAFMLKHYGREDTSALVRVIEVEGQRLGALVLLAAGRDRYSDIHGRLFDLLNEPFAVAVSNTLEHETVLRLKEMLADDNRFLRRELLHLSGDDIVGREFGLKSTMTMVEHVAPMDSPVLLMGETGVGKDVIAGAIHYASPRREGPFVKVNCGALPESLIDSELFGHEKGAFTGALTQRRGRFERAHGGTIFLDEVAELPLPAQVRMLRVLQNGEVERVGGNHCIEVDVRLIAATNQDIEAMVRTKSFREDLFFRLNVFPITVPPLRARKGDIPALVHYFIQRKSRELRLPQPPLAPGMVDRLTDYHWPGNVRELENIVERALILGRGEKLTIPELTGVDTRPTASVAGNDDAVQRLDEVIATHIRGILEKTGGKIHGSGGAAELLGINPSTLRNRMNQLGIAYGRRRQKRD